MPPTIQAVDWTEEFVVDEVSVKAANRIASLIAHWDDTLAVDTFAPGVEQRGAKRRLARAAIDYGTCTFGKGTFERERDAWFHNPGHSRFELTCEERLLALSFKLDNMGKVVEFSLNPPRQPEANCWQ